MNTLTQDTNTLKTLIALAEKTGKASIEAGKILSNIKNKKLYESQYKNFSDYVVVALKISETKANLYINVYQNFDSFGLDKDYEVLFSNILVSHLDVLLDLGKNNINMKTTLSAIQDFLIEKKDQKKENLRPNFETTDIFLLVNLIKDIEDEENKEKIKKLLKDIVDKSSEYKNQKQKNDKIFKEINESQHEILSSPKKYSYDKFGKPLKCNFFEDLENIIENEPVDEQGFVALFCYLFNMLKNTSFQLFEKIFYFESIFLVRSGYPDAIIRLKQQKNIFSIIKVEFEFQSSRFLRDKHLEKSDERCDLIICWEHDLKGTTIEKYLKKLPQHKKFPQIISIKDVLETGKIEVMDNK